MKRSVVVFVGLVALGGTRASAQIPTTFRNLQVLPADTTQAALIATMREFATALGVRCNYCHVGDNPATLEHFDFAADTKATKQTARGMMRMVREINSHLLPAARPAPTATVACLTCHRGLAVPRTLLEVLRATIEHDGVNAAMAQYRTLREQGYGKGTYDFSDVTLNGLAEWLARQKGNVDGAIVIQNFNVEVNPNLWTSYSLLANLYQQQGDKASARTSIERALQLDPNNDFLKKRLDELR
jgi:tetratricopeptide (TPR) repeat protein